MPEVINPDTVSAPRGYSNGLLFPAGGRLLFVAGQVAWDRSEKIVSPELGPQFAQALRNVLDVVRAAGGGPEHIGRFTIYVTDKDRYIAARKEIGAAYREQMGRAYPAMALVQVAALLEDGAMVEIEATAVLP